jgi:hypothetical protein
MLAPARSDGAAAVPSEISSEEDLVDQLLRELSELEGLVEQRS